MSQDRVDNDEFLTRLTSLFTSTHSTGHGSVYLTQKPLTTADSPGSTDASPSGQILVRATNGLSKAHRVAKPKDKLRPKVKVATVVDEADLEAFYTKYAEVCKKGMESLRKRDKKKAKEKAKAKKKKGEAKA